MIALPEKWTAYLMTQSETGMGYQVVSLVLADGRKFHQVIVTDGHILKCEVSAEFHSPQIRSHE
jgi:hypothetical protein